MRVSELVSDLHALRANLATELEAVNRYEPQVDGVAHDEARAVVRRIADAHKQHVAWLVEAIEQLDPTQAELARSARGAA